MTYVVSAGTGNQAPVAMDDSAVKVEGTAVTVAVLANDWDPNGDLLTVILTTQGAHGQVSLNGDGTVPYMPARRSRVATASAIPLLMGSTPWLQLLLIVQPKSGGGKPGGK